MQLSLNASELVRSSVLVSDRLLRLSTCWLGTIIRVTSGHSGGTKRLGSLRGGKMAKNIIGFISFLYLMATAAHPASSQSVQDWLQYLVLLITLGYMFD